MLEVTRLPLKFGGASKDHCKNLATSHRNHAHANANGFEVQCMYCRDQESALLKEARELTALLNSIQQGPIRFVECFITSRSAGAVQVFPYLATNLSTMLAVKAVTVCCLVLGTQGIHIIFLTNMISS